MPSPVKKVSSMNKNGCSGQNKQACSSKQGGDLVQHVTGLAVPFAFLLAKQGLDALRKSHGEKDDKTLKTKSGKKATLSGGRTPKGGACSSCPSMRGGRAQQVSQKLDRLRKDIDNFLAKY